MRDSFKKIIALLCAAVMLVSFAGCSRSDPADPYDIIPESTGGKDVERAEAADNVFSLNTNSKYSLNPLIATNHSNQLVCSLVYENMVEVDNEFNIHYNVITDGICSEDGKTWEFAIDTSKTFHDGTNISGKDLRYSLERAINSDRFRGRFASIQGVSYTDSKLYVTLGIGNTQFEKLLNIPVIKAGTFDDDHPTGSGPYMYNEDFTQLLAREGHNGYESLPVDVIYLKEYQDAGSTIAAFEDSLIDIVVNDPSSYTNLGYASTNESRSFATTNMHYVAFNEDGMLGGYSNVRVALSFAFDRDYFAEELMKGNAVAAALPMYPTCSLYPDSVADQMEFDLETCRIILENFGIMDYDDDGKLEFMNGGAVDIEMVLILCSDSSAKAGVARKFAEDLESIGFTVTVRELTWSEYTTALEEGKLEDGTVFDMYYAEVKLRNDFDMTEILQVRNEKEPGTNINFTNSQDKTYEMYINDYLKATDNDRPYKYHTFCDYLRNNAPIVVIGFEKQVIISHRGVIKGINANIGNPLYDFANWTIELD